MIEPRVYVSTYGKYNDGNLKGAWLNLEDFSNAEAFYAACRKLHSDEHDPEIMFQDFEGFPSGYLQSSGARRIRRELRVPRRLGVSDSP